ncbi:MAG: linear amide C-N hydrolase [Ignavibacteria bacterium]
MAKNIGIINHQQTDSQIISHGSMMRYCKRMLSRLGTLMLLVVFSTSAFNADAQSRIDSQTPLDDESCPIGCTRVLWNDNPVAVLVGRTQDWFNASNTKDPSDPTLLVMPRGLRKSGANSGETVVVTENPATWTSRYGSVVVANQNLVVLDGMNEKGLSSHALALFPSDYGTRDVRLKGVAMGLLVPYVLDNAATVEEALSLIAEIQPVASLLDNFTIRLALTIEDRFGNSAVVEYPDSSKGVAKIYQGRDVRVFANLDIDKSRTIQQRDYPFDVATATRNTIIPGNGGRINRYVRAAFFDAYLSELQPRDLLEAKAAMMSVMRSVSNPIGAPGDKPGKGPYYGDETSSVTIADLTNLVYVFDSDRTLTSLSTDLRRLDFRPGSGVRIVNPQDPRINGDVTKRYKRVRKSVPGLVD